MDEQKKQKCVQFSIDILTSAVNQILNNADLTDEQKVFCLHLVSVGFAESIHEHYPNAKILFGPLPKNQNN